MYLKIWPNGQKFIKNHLFYLLKQIFYCRFAKKVNKFSITITTMKTIITLLLGTFLCVLSFAENNSSAIVYAEDSLSAELKIGSIYFDGEEHRFTFELPKTK